MSNFKKWINGELDVFNQEVAPKELERIEGLDAQRLKRAVTNQEKKEIVHTNIKKFNYLYVLISLIVVVVYIGILFIMASYLPAFGKYVSEVPYDYYYVGNYYILHALEDTMSINSVTGMILDYRAFDTLGESFVLFTGVTCVFILLAGLKDEHDEHVKQGIVMHKDVILRYVASILIPIVFVFGIYVVLNGHLSPGGGFSGGAILGAGLILFSLAFGDEVAQRFFKLKTFKTISAVALLGYAGVKCYSFLMGGMHVLSEDSHLWHDPISEFFHSLPIGSIASGGYILILNICVGAVVACTMYGLYSLFKKGEI